MTKPELLKTVLLVIGLSVSVPVLVTATYLGYSGATRRSLPKFKTIHLTLDQSAELESLLDLPRLRTRPILLEIGDYQCPACRQAEQWIDANGSRVARLADYRFVDLPLNQHEFAPLASKVAIAGRSTGHSLQIHRWLMETTDLREASIKKYAFGVGNGSRVWSAAHGKYVQSVLANEKRAAEILQTGATPSFYTLYPDHSISQTFLVTDVLSVLASGNA